MSSTKEEKVKLARRLMMEVDAEEMRERKLEDENIICQCGHKHNEHTRSYDINYSGGFCKQCDCKHFLMKK